jgi:hypothetical protein
MQVRLFHVMPHPNVVRAPAIDTCLGSTWRLALWDCVPSFDGWSCAYTAASILVQVQAFLLDDDLLVHDQKVRAFSLILSLNHKTAKLLVRCTLPYSALHGNAIRCRTMRKSWL